MTLPAAHFNKAQQWPLWKDKAVLMVLAGRTQEEVGEAFGVSQSTISYILKDPRAEEIIIAARARLREKLVEDIEVELDSMSKLAAATLKKTLEAEISTTHPAKSNQDRVAVKLLQGRGFLSADGKGSSAGFQVSPEQMDRLLIALEKSDRALEVEVFGENGQDAAVEADFEVVEAKEGT